MKTLTQMAADIVIAQASHVYMSAEELNDMVNKVFKTLEELDDIEISEVEYGM